MLALRDFRFFWGAQFLSALVHGILRFAFIWLVLEITTWPPAVGLMGLAVGLPGLVVSLPAGVLSDRMDRRVLVVRVAIAGAAVLGVTAALILTELMNVPLAMLMAVLSGAAVTASLPAFQAMVPQLVPPERLMSGVAIQNMGQPVSTILGAVVGGGTIALLGLGVGFAVWAVLLLLSAAMMLPMRLPRPALGDAATVPAGRPGSPSTAGWMDDIRAGIGYAFSREPVRSLLAAGLFMGVGMGAYGVLVPDVARNQLGQDAFSTSILFAGLSAGMLASSLILASRRELRRKGLLFLFAMMCFGPGLMVIGLSQLYLLTAGFMVVWGFAGGILVTSQRTLLQEHTAPAMMGRVMSIMSLSFSGMLPFAALIIVGLRGSFSAGNTLALFGAVMLAGGVVIAVRGRELRAA